MKYNTLIVDDDEIVAASLKDFLELFGIFDTTIAQSGKKALELIKLNEYDLWLVDQRMPEMTGVEFIYQGVRKLQSSSERPVICGVTAEDNNIMLKSAEEKIIPLDHYISKPWDRKDASVNLKILLGKRDEIIGSRSSIEKHYAQRLEVETQLAAAEEELNLSLKQAKEKAEAESKAQFFANMSHEIRTPMTIVMGMIDMVLKYEPQISEKAIKRLKMAKESGKNLLIIVDNILNVSKIESGKLEVVEQPYNLEKSLETLIAGHKVIIGQNKKDVDIRLDYSNKLSKYILGDNGKITQIVHNLVGNAVKFTEKGYIAINVKLTESKKLELIVKDTGIGIAKDNLEKILKPFEQAEVNTTKLFGGTGLGLSITKKLSEMLDCKLQVSSTYGEGSTFCVTIPYKPTETIGETIDVKKIDIENFDPGKYTILLAEDNKTNQLIASHFIKELGYKILIANDGHEAFSIYKTNPINLILMDIQMPNMDGFDATKLIRQYEKEESIKPIPIIAQTAAATDDVKQKCIVAGMEDYLTKPISKEKIRDKIALYLSNILEKNTK